MKKPLQERNDLAETIKNGFAYRQGHIVFPFIATERGKYISRNTGDIDFLLETANKYLESTDSKDSTFYFQFGRALGLWMDRFLTEGFTTPMLQALRKELGEIRFFHVLNPAIPSRGKPFPHWDYIADTEDFIDPKKVAAYAFSQQLTLDGFVQLKRCQVKTCRRFFTRRRDTKWCSLSCGSKYRVTLKRKRDKSR